MKALILDTETTGLDPERHTCIEVAVCLYDLSLAAPIMSYASLLRHDSNEAEGINGISPELLVDAPTPDFVWGSVGQLSGGADVILAHRAEFDRGFVPSGVLLQPWVCTKTDVRWPGRLRGESLVQLALALGLGVASAHRAMADVDTLARILTRVAERGCDLVALIKNAMRPKKLFYAQVTFDKRQLAKDHGFLWDESKHGKHWYRYMPPEDTHELPFSVFEAEFYLMPGERK